MRFEFDGMRVDGRVLLIGRCRLSPAERHLEAMRVAKVAYEGSPIPIVILEGHTRRVHEMNDRAQMLLCPVSDFRAGACLDTSTGQVEVQSSF